MNWNKIYLIEEENKNKLQEVFDVKNNLIYITPIITKPLNKNDIIFGKFNYNHNLFSKNYGFYKDLLYENGIDIDEVI